MATRLHYHVTDNVATFRAGGLLGAESSSTFSALPRMTSFLKLFDPAVRISDADCGRLGHENQLFSTLEAAARTVLDDASETASIMDLAHRLHTSLLTGILDQPFDPVAVAARVPVSLLKQLVVILYSLSKLAAANAGLHQRLLAFLGGDGRPHFLTALLFLHLDGFNGLESLRFLLGRRYRHLWPLETNVGSR
jgi:hypothetical protein